MRDVTRAFPSTSAWFPCLLRTVSRAMRIGALVLPALLLVTAALPRTAAAATIELQLDELSTALEDIGAEPDALQRLVLSRIQAALHQSDLVFDDGQLLLQDHREDMTIEDGCTRTIVQRLDTTISVDGQSALQLDLDSLHRPVSLSLTLRTRIVASGRARQVFGIRLGSCQWLGRETFDFSASGPLALSLTVQLDANPHWAADDLLQLRPVVTVEGRLLESDIVVDVDDSIMRVLLERVIQSVVDERFGAASLREEISGLQASVDEWLDAAGDGGIIDVRLPPPDDAQIEALYQLFDEDARFPLTLGYIEVQRLPLLAALIMGDSTALEDILSDAVICQASTALQVPVPPEPTTTPYSDADPVMFCRDVLDHERFGNADAAADMLGLWQLSPGNTFDIGALSLANLAQPYMQRVDYARPAGEAGECALEMRIYSANPDRTGQGAVLALHGGSWQHRSTGFLGIEAMATQFTSRGFVVFAPFYRLLGSDEGTPACHDASLAQLQDDASAALDWVLANGSGFGASGAPVVFGQSAGGHLALTLAVERPADVDRAVLFYAPSDFTHFAEHVLDGSYDSPQGQRILQAVIGGPLDTLDIDSPLIRRNSFPSRILDEAIDAPPMFLLHGEKDTLLPFQQSSRLCNALAGTLDGQAPAPLTERTVADGEVPRVVSCDRRGSVLHLLAQGQHAPDLCIAPTLCQAGDERARQYTAQSVTGMLDWIALPHAALAPPPLDDATGGSAGAVQGVGLLPLLLQLLCRRRVVGGCRSPVSTIAPDTGNRL